MIAICIDEIMTEGRIAMKLNLNEKYNVYLLQDSYYVYTLDGTFCGIHEKDRFILLAEWREQQINDILN